MAFLRRYVCVSVLSVVLVLCSTVAYAGVGSGSTGGPPVDEAVVAAVPVAQAPAWLSTLAAVPEPAVLLFLSLYPLGTALRRGLVPATVNIRR